MIELEKSITSHAYYHASKTTTFKHPLFRHLEIPRNIAKQRGERVTPEI